LGAKTCLLAHVDAGRDARSILSAGPELDEQVTRDLVGALFPAARFAEPLPADLSTTYLSDRSVVAGVFPGLRIVVSAEVAVSVPSEFPPEFIDSQGTTILHTMHSVSDWLAFAVWRDGVLVRSLCVSPDSGVTEDIGERLAFETPFWDGEHPACDPDEEPGYPLPFHPLELGEEALREFFGFQIEGYVDSTLLEPESISMLRFDEPGKLARPVARPLAGARPWWKFW
jgi:hypothetical protein